MSGVCDWTAAVQHLGSGAEVAGGAGQARSRALHAGQVRELGLV